MARARRGRRRGAGQAGRDAPAHGDVRLPRVARRGSARTAAGRVRLDVWLGRARPRPDHPRRQPLDGGAVRWPRRHRRDLRRRSTASRCDASSGAGAGNVPPVRSRVPARCCSPRGWMRMHGISASDRRLDGRVGVDAGLLFEAEVEHVIQQRRRPSARVGGAARRRARRPALRPPIRARGQGLRDNGTGGAPCRASPLSSHPARALRGLAARHISTAARRTNGAGAGP
jgi:hypothetical protein